MKRPRLKTEDHGLMEYWLRNCQRTHKVHTQWGCKQCSHYVKCCVLQRRIFGEVLIE